MTRTEPIVEKRGCIEVINQFSRVFKKMRVKEMIIQGNKACYWKL
ncbi:MAG: hypothetical protein AVDCRST_MAG96-3615 [uncultured Segetibacter sp.]|uniref:Uncharacterized protein n=1 Tax=uncultured Segetibacter sp. TaxID=481133 RepID=A0A6J4TV76_9BACT|nr:MAG: hypothetical protein AVDCRST_MAG96-3615 [uncultured Segetibacter sp.]